MRKASAQAGCQSGSAVHSARHCLHTTCTRPSSYGGSCASTDSSSSTGSFLWIGARSTASCAPQGERRSLPVRTVGQGGAGALLGLMYSRASMRSSQSTQHELGCHSVLQGSGVLRLKARWQCSSSGRWGSLPALCWR